MTDATLPAVADAGPGAVRRFFKAYPPFVILALVWIALTIVVAIFADLLKPYDFKALDLRDRLAEPVFMNGTFRHILGSDELGRDVLSRLIESIRMSLTIAFASTLITAAIGVGLGFLAAHFRGWVEQLVLGAIDFMAAIPFLIVALAVLAFFGNSLTLFILLMGMHGWERIARITRGLAIAAQEQGYASAAREIGASPWRVYGMHILPNIASTLIVAMTLNIPEVILLESGLSFLGLGVQPPLTSLGNMVGYGREYIQTAPWILLAPAIVITLTTLAVSILGDWLRDRFDPTLR
ncbi:MAG: ABC transporter permease [Alphaproteobacteria bacterium]|jgi:peptide/nickel transport system permease protein